MAKDSHNSSCGSRGGTLIWDQKKKKHYCFKTVRKSKRNGCGGRVALTARGAFYYKSANGRRTYCTGKRMPVRLFKKKRS